MKGPKWLIMFVSALMLTFVVWGGINVAVDPFGVFGDPLLDWGAYSQTLNPRTGKAAFLNEHWDEFDSYIIGSSSAASYLPQTLEKYDGGSWYNMFHYGADISYDKQLIRWIIENDDVRHIVLVLGLNEANFEFKYEDLTDRAHCYVTGENSLSYYTDFLFAPLSYAREKLTSRASDTEMPQAFDVFIAEDGIYDKRLRDVESIGSIEAYLSKNGDSFWHPTAQGYLSRIDECVNEVKEIKALCDEASVKLTVILSPVYEGQLSGITDESLNSYFSAIAEVTEYWNFAISPISYDARYFYDMTHTRNATADMVLARVFGDSEAYVPDNFGMLCKDGVNPSAESMKLTATDTADQKVNVNVPILLYHHIDNESEEIGAVIHSDTFESHMKLLLENGYTTVSFSDIIDYVERGIDLPEKPIIVTFDDGYYSNYEYAFPILEQNGQKATIFIIGSSVGNYETYKDTDYPITPHFGVEEISEMVSSGCIDIQSHTFDMHQWGPYEDGIDVRETMLPINGESEADYIEALTEDVKAQKQLFSECGLPTPDVLSFPLGEVTDIANVIHVGNGFKVTLTTDSTRHNDLVPGLPQSLIGLGRMIVYGNTTSEDILRYCETFAETAE